MIGIITYDTPHRKTQDLLFQLIARGYTDLRVIALPFEVRKNFKPLFRHRPNKVIDVHPKKMCERLGINYITTNDLLESLDGLTDILIGGAGILPCEVVKKYGIINSHPGWLPEIRGLDAIKWPILNGNPIGITTHYIGEKADTGVLIKQELVPMYYEDSFYSFAYRAYEQEIKMLVDAIEDHKGCLELQDIGKPTRRMPHSTELKMLDKFEILRKKAPNK